ncbi:MAG: 1-acyl-sn-glycerol-3-phosphate acyltransferase [Bacteroidetes bacterium HGW-Bacteroidetes-13]|nr:MAG: 1-acyl-sn-glycerol-3-phosphate acyltransferase [Bacteroidetes bacterium HGW-Bacteroidetes-13]
MHKFISYILSVFYYLAFGLTLVVFHPIQWICLKLGGYRWHKISVDWLNFFLNASLWVMGVFYRFEFAEKLPSGRPIIFVSNHQSLHDIPPMIWKFRRFHPKFVAKKELGNGIPSVSFNLRHGGAALIDRKDPTQAIPALLKFAKYLNTHQRSAVIFPEGTRSKDGVPKRFAPGGFKVLIENIPNALIVPVSINNSWKVIRYGSFPLSAGERITFYVHSPIDPVGKTFEEVFALTEKAVKSRINESI